MGPFLWEYLFQSVFNAPLPDAYAYWSHIDFTEAIDELAYFVSLVFDPNLFSAASHFAVRYSRVDLFYNEYISQRICNISKKILKVKSHLMVHFDNVPT